MMKLVCLGLLCSNVLNKILSSRFKDTPSSNLNYYRNILKDWSLNCPALFAAAMSQSVQAAVIGYHRLGGLNNTHLFLIVLEAADSEIRVPQCSDSGKSPLPHFLTM